MVYKPNFEENGRIFEVVMNRQAFYIEHEREGERKKEGLI